MLYVRFLGIIFLCIVFLAFGTFTLMDPHGTASMIKGSNFPTLLKISKIPFHPDDAQYVMLVQAIGGAVLVFSAFVIFGVARSFSTVMLTDFVVGVTVCMHINIDDVKATTVENQIAVLKNLALVGALFVVASITPPQANSNAKKKKTQIDA